MTPGAFVDILAQNLGLPRKSVAVIDRVLAKAGLRSLGGRGPSAAQVTPRDAATLLVAAMASPILTHAAEVVLTWQRVVSIGIPKDLPPPFDELSELGQLVPLPVLVQHLIETPPEAWREFHAVLELGVDQRIATLRVTKGAKKAFQINFAEIADERPEAGRRPPHGDLNRLALVTNETFQALHGALMTPPERSAPQIRRRKGASA
jgi:hypothetical protein